MAATNITRVIFAVITPHEDISLQCTTSLLKLQQVAARRADLVLDFHILSNTGEALNMHSQGDYLVVVHANTGFSTDLVLGAIDGTHEAVFGVYPLPKVDWERVKHRLTTPSPEPIDRAGNVYNITPETSTMGRYVPVKSIKESKVMILKSTVVAAMTGDHTLCTKDTRPFHILHYDSAKDGTWCNGDQTFFRALQQHSVPVVADVQEQCTFSGNAQFAGCVGQRGFVR